MRQTGFHTMIHSGTHHHNIVRARCYSAGKGKKQNGKKYVHAVLTRLKQQMLLMAW
jgi:hypothetical protein